jgi:PHD/YefM family antitoxin component YafN of YafNO toxin-antitoxin module
MERTAESHEPIQINGRRRSAVLVSEEDWRATQETLYLLSWHARIHPQRSQDAPLQDQ